MCGRRRSSTAASTQEAEVEETVAKEEAKDPGYKVYSQAELDAANAYQLKSGAVVSRDEYNADGTRKSKASSTTEKRTTAGSTTKERTITETDKAEKASDIKSVAGASVGDTSITYQTIVQDTTAKEASQKQEELAAAELSRARQARAESKRSLLRRRLERTQEYGSGKRVLSGMERALPDQQRSTRIAQATGRRSGTGRKSLMTGSRGGIGFYSRYQ
jgi:hypothetical protein